MSEKQKDKEIAASFMRASLYDESKFGHVISMPKLNGLRCMYVPNRGFFSRDGLRWDDSVLAHIVMPETPYPIDGELYCHGMPLQNISKAVAVTRQSPGAEAHKITFFAFDLIKPRTNAITRMWELMEIYEVHRDKIDNTKTVSSVVCKTRIDVDKCYEQYIILNFEGQMLKSVFGDYVSQGEKERATLNLQKRKAFLDAEFECVGFTLGEGRCAGKLGALEFITPKGVRFEVGTGFTDEDRELFIHPTFNPKGQKATIKYLNLTEDGKPFNASFVAWRSVK